MYGFPLEMIFMLIQPLFLLPRAASHIYFHDVPFWVAETPNFFHDESCWTPHLEIFSRHLMIYHRLYHQYISRCRVTPFRVHKSHLPSTDSPARMLRAAHGRLELLFPVPRNSRDWWEVSHRKGPKFERFQLVYGIGFRMDIATVGWCESQ